MGLPLHSKTADNAGEMLDCIWNMEYGIWNMEYGYRYGYDDMRIASMANPKYTYGCHEYVM